MMKISADTVNFLGDVFVGGEKVMFCNWFDIETREINMMVHLSDGTGLLTMVDGRCEFFNVTLNPTPETECKFISNDGRIVIIF